MIKALILKPWPIFHSENFKRIPLIKKNILIKFGLNKKSIRSLDQSTQFEPSWGLVIICVDPVFHGKGIGSMLL